MNRWAIILAAWLGLAGSLSAQTFPGDWAGYIEATADAPAGALTDFPFVIQIDSSNADFWANVRSDGGDIRVTIDGTQVAVDPLNDRAEWNYAGQQAVIVAKGPASLTTAPVIRVYAGCPSATTPADTDTYGRENAYKSAIRAVWPSGAGVDRTGHDNDLTMTGSPTEGGVAGRLNGTFATNYDGSTQYGTANAVMPSGIANGGRPYSVFSVFRSEQDTANVTIAGLGSTTTNTHSSFLTWAGASSDVLQFSAVGTSTRTASQGTLTINAWHHGVGRDQAFANHLVSRDGAAASANTSGATMDVYSAQYFVGARVNATASAYFDGDIGWTMFASEDWGNDWTAYLHSMFIDPDQSDFYNGWTANFAAGGSPKISPALLNSVIQ